MANMTHKKRSRLQNDFLKAYKASAGNVSHACEKIGISRNCFYEWKKNFPEFNERFVEAEESLIDLVETKLMKAINDDNVTATIFFLKTKGKHRGYVETVENINHDVSKYKGKTREELEARLKQLREKHAKS